MSSITAQILVNGSPGASINCPINVPVTLVPVLEGAVAQTFLWTIQNQPVGTTQVVFNGSGGLTSDLPTESITPVLQGSIRATCLINPTVPAVSALASSIIGVRQERTQIRVPAVGETTETGSDGWADEENVTMQLVDSSTADPGLAVMIDGYGASVDDVVEISSVSYIMPGLPQQAAMPVITLGTAASSGSVSQTYGIVQGPVSGSVLSSGSLTSVRRYGIHKLTSETAYAQGVSLFLQNTPGGLGISPGTNRRLLAKALGNIGGGSGQYIDFDGALFDASAATGADPNSSYVVIAQDGINVNERTLTAGSGITITDGGAGGNVTIAASGSVYADLFSSYIVVTKDGENPNERVIAGSGGTAVTDGGAGSSLTVSSSIGVASIYGGGSVTATRTGANYTISGSGGGFLTNLQGTGGTSVTFTGTSAVVSSSAPAVQNIVGAGAVGVTNSGTTWTISGSGAGISGIAGQGGTTVTLSGNDAVVSSSAPAFDTIIGQGNVTVTGPVGDQLTLSSSIGVLSIFGQGTITATRTGANYTISGSGGGLSGISGIGGTSVVTTGNDAVVSSSAPAVQNIVGAGVVGVTNSGTTWTISGSGGGFLTNLQGTGGTSVTFTGTSAVVSSSAPPWTTILGNGGTAVSTVGATLTVSSSKPPFDTLLGAGGSTVTLLGDQATVSSSIGVLAIFGSGGVTAVRTGANYTISGSGGGISGIAGQGGTTVTLSGNDATVSSSIGALQQASYVVVGLDAENSQERKLTAGSGITLTDGGAAGNITVAAPGAWNVVNFTATATLSTPTQPTMVALFTSVQNMTATLPSPTTIKGVPICFKDVQGFASASSASTVLISPAAAGSTIESITGSYTMQVPWGAITFMSLDGDTWNITSTG